MTDSGNNSDLNRAELRYGRTMRKWSPRLKRNQSNGTYSFQLLPLTPDYEQSHEVYFTALEAALAESEQSRVRNIALTGSYGVGKSSILQKVVETHKGRVVQISLSSLGLSDQSLQADSHSGAPVSKTNLIQKEIVKQLLYREAPVKMPGSRYRRLERFQVTRAFLVAVLAALVLALGFYLAGWTAKIEQLTSQYTNLGNAVHLVILAGNTLFVLALAKLFHNRVTIEKLSAGAATISLSANAATFFDEYLDEIVYFFDVTRCDIVILEDLDRFDDPHIFETLRALNTLLNGARQLQRRNIRFIYAIKDSVFDALGARAAFEERGVSAGNELNDALGLSIARSNRTKFFDLVIPIVPFITHRNARDLMVRIMGDLDHQISAALFDLAARHLPDMRLIKNVRNEYVIFREKILRGQESIPGLTEDQLFAMLLYKSTHLSDFEAIKDGQSKLDLLYSDARRLVASNMATLEAEALAIRFRIENLDSVAPRSESLGANLMRYVEQVQRQIRANEPVQREVKFDGQRKSEDELRSADFWREFIAAEGTLDVAYTTYRSPLLTLNISRTDVCEIVGDPLSLGDWQENDRAILNERLAQIEVERDFLAHADMEHLIGREEFKLSSCDGVAKSMRQLANEWSEPQKTDQSQSQLFSDWR